MNDLKQSKLADDLLPADLSAWMDKRDLVSLILDVVQPIGWQTAEFNRDSGFDQRLRPRMLLTLLTYCYAIGIHGSHEIELSISRDETVRYLCARANPNWNDLRRFRRENKAVIHQALTDVFVAVWEFKLWMSVSFHSTLEFSLQERHQQDIRLRDQFSRLAEERIRTAVFLDSMMLDD
jgi:transposase